MACIGRHIAIYLSGHSNALLLGILKRLKYPFQSPLISVFIYANFYCFSDCLQRYKKHTICSNLDNVAKKNAR
jgi:hypothetical protein